MVGEITKEPPQGLIDTLYTAMASISHHTPRMYLPMSSSPSSSPLLFSLSLILRTAQHIMWVESETVHIQHTFPPLKYNKFVLKHYQEPHRPFLYYVKSFLLFPHNETGNKRLSGYLHIETLYTFQFSLTPPSLPPIHPSSRPNHHIVILCTYLHLQGMSSPTYLPPSAS